MKVSSLGKPPPVLTNVFQLHWNHHLALFLFVCFCLKGATFHIIPPSLYITAPGSSTSYPMPPPMMHWEGVDGLNPMSVLLASAPAASDVPAPLTRNFYPGALPCGTSRPYEPGYMPYSGGRTGDIINFQQFEGFWRPKVSIWSLVLCTVEMNWNRFELIWIILIFDMFL